MEIITANNKTCVEDLFSEVKLSLKLACPIIFTRLVSAMSNFIAMLMIAKLGRNALAAGALITSIYTSLMMVSWALLFSVSAVIAKMLGENKHEQIGIILRQGFVLATLSGFPLIIIMWYIGPILYFFKQPNEIIYDVVPYFHAVVYGVLPCVWVATINQFCNGIFRPYIVTIATLLNVVFSSLLGYMLLFGKFGFPNLGIAGVGYAISIVYWVNFLALLFYLYINSSYKSFRIFKAIKYSHTHYLKLLFKIGWPISIQYGSELLAFTLLTLLMGIFGVDVLAAQQISMQCTLIVIMVPFALSQASAILVGEANGSKNIVVAKKRGYTTIALGVLVMIMVALFYWCYSPSLISFYLNIHNPVNNHIVYIATILLAISAITQIIDAIKNIATGALRGFYDTKVPMLIGVISYWIIGLPLAFLFSFIFHWGPIALRIGFLLGILVGAILLITRFNRIDTQHK